MKKRIVLLIAPLLLLVTSISYGFFMYYQEGNDHTAIAGSLYMDIIGDEEVNIKGMYPMTDEEGIENGVKYNFSVSGYNTTDKDIYYGVYVIDGDEISGKTRFKHTDIKVYLEETINGETKTVYGPVNLQDFNESLIHVNIVDANIAKDNEIKIDYTLTMWLDQRVLISDTETDIPGRSIYTSDEFKNSYASLKIEVEGLLEKMNMPLSIETSDTYVENNKAYFIAKISNYHKSEDLGQNADDEMKLEITGTNSDIVFSYKDSEENIVTDTSETLDLTYLFNKNKSIEIQVFVIPKNDANATTDISLKLTQNGEVKQNIIKTMNVFGNNFCLNNGFTKLYDCILASDSLATDIETAKVNIENKGEPNLNDTAPTYTYVEDITYDVENVYSTSPMVYAFADSYQLNQESGYLELVNTDGSAVIRDSLSDNYINYYTCGVNSKNTSHCDVVYLVKGTSISESTYTISLGDKIVPKISSNIKNEVGLYKTEDDYGDSYVFRGDVSNNNVAFGGYYWKILRTNGDNSIRLIYTGEVTNATGDNTSINNTLYPYSDSSKFHDPAYLGYMYGKNFAVQTSEETWFDSFNAQIQYYWADSYVFDSETERFNLKSENLDIVKGTFEEMQDKFEQYPYTCTDSGVTQNCGVIVKVKNYTASTVTATVQYVSYSSTSKDGTRTNEVSSNAKVELEKWYETNLVNKNDDNGKLITDYIVDGTFCNDRSTPVAVYSSGYLLSPATYYAPYTRLTSSSITTTLKCSTDIRDKFSSTTSKGNGLLKYPVALITADEVVLAGGKYQVQNENYYLKTNNYYWTMSPAMFAQQNAGALSWFVSSNGSVTMWDFVYASRGLRPVINLRSDVLISSGDGSVENPFQLKLD